MEAALKERPYGDRNGMVYPQMRYQSFRLRRTKGRSILLSIDWTAYPLLTNDPSTSDVIAPSPWSIFGCKNGLRIFKESKDRSIPVKGWNEDPAIMAVGVVDATSEAIFRTVMSLGSSRSEWDFCLSQGKVVEHIDGHTDIIHKQLKDDWMPWGMRRRDLLLRRYWRREDDGTYVILYHSVLHERCQPLSGYVRACLKSGGYVISPINQGKQSVVKHMLDIDWKFWKTYLLKSSAQEVTIRMLERISALRELFRAKVGHFPPFDFSSGELTGITAQEGEDDIKEFLLPWKDGGSGRDSVEVSKRSSPKSGKVCGSFLELSDAADEFFDAEPSEPDNQETWPANSILQSKEQRQNKLSTAAVFVKKLHDLATQKRGYVDLQEADPVDNTSSIYGTTLPKDEYCNLASSWTSTDPSTFLIRGKTYLQDNIKIKANSTLMQMLGADWLKSDKREDDLAGRSGGIVQKYAAQGRKEFFFIVNIQVPGSTTYSLALYYMMDIPLESVPLLNSFVNGDDAFRNSRFKLIPYISKGSWIVKQSVGKKACLVGQALEINYFRGTNYLELGVDIGSSTVARGVVSLVLGYLNNLVIEMAFLVQGNNSDELPEFLLGTCRLNHLDIAKSVPVK
ncbi:protein ENHANCED DISEASE RESISTANCE 2-like isoform X2 [Wolffia australiana]